ncbi:Qat anti-phage system associated protein QatB [Variovorax sp. PAMC26660]|uniref:Qat anti-phage system associated protein QatB n=1 Tax=Variovorax sp. PAMC26660 TaxID=2762322 RepID=UPI001C9BB316|nr:Qat anti-phage system associated protein QatB [Variovorax sp. PAMC26660]
MSAYLSGGGRESLRSAAKNMVNRGMGGPRRAASTMRGTSQGAGQLGQFLASARDGTDPRVVDWVQRVRGSNLSAGDLILELVKEVLPDTGSVDDESLRNAAAEALGKLYETAPDVDVFNLNNDQIAEVIGLTIANDVCNRMDLQLGQTYERLKFDPQQVQLYRNDVKEYVHAEVRVVMERHSALRMDPQRLAKEVLASTLEVFAE